MSLLFSPAHLHLALNHVPIIGLTVACLPVLLGLLFRSHGALASGLLAVLLCIGSMPFIMQTGEAARESFVDGTIDPGMDTAGKAAFREHSGRAKATAPVAYASGILALLALIALLKFPVQAAWISYGVLLGCTLSIALGIWTAEAGGRIRHTEFRPPGKTETAPLPVLPSSLPSPASTPVQALPQSADTNPSSAISPSSGIPSPFAPATPVGVTTNAP